MKNRRKSVSTYDLSLESTRITVDLEFTKFRWKQSGMVHKLEKLQKQQICVLIVLDLSYENIKIVGQNLGPYTRDRKTNNTATTCYETFDARH